MQSYLRRLHYHQQESKVTKEQVRHGSDLNAVFRRFHYHQQESKSPVVTKSQPNAVFFLIWINVGFNDIVSKKSPGVNNKSEKSPGVSSMR